MFWITNSKKMSNWENPLLLKPSSMKSAITNSALYITIHPISNVRMVLPQVKPSINCIYATHTSSPTIQHEGITFYDALQTEVLEAPTSSQVIVPKTTIKRSPDFQQLRPFFGLMSTDIIQKKFEHTTQYTCIPTGNMLTKIFRYPHPALNLYRQNEDVACNIAYSFVPAIFDGSMAAIIFFGTSGN
jgi:hypothetical protein